MRYHPLAGKQVIYPVSRWNGKVTYAAGKVMRVNQRGAFLRVAGGREVLVPLCCLQEA